MNQDRNVERAASLDCATLSDALDRIGIHGQCAWIKARADEFRLTGRAFTLLYGPASKPAGTILQQTVDEPMRRIIPVWSFLGSKTTL